MRPLMRQPEFCAACHKSAIVPELNGRKWFRTFSVYDEWQQSAFSNQTARPLNAKPYKDCRSCHMPQQPRRVTRRKVQPARRADGARRGRRARDGDARREGRGQLVRADRARDGRRDGRRHDQTLERGDGARDAGPCLRWLITPHSHSTANCYLASPVASLPADLHLFIYHLALSRSERTQDETALSQTRAAVSQNRFGARQSPRRFQFILTPAGREDG